MKNDQGNKTRRRKVALSARERNLTTYNGLLSAGKNPFTGEAFTDEEKASQQSRIDRTSQEIATLKKKIGGSYVS